MNKILLRKQLMKILKLKTYSVDTHKALANYLQKDKLISAAANLFLNGLFWAKKTNDSFRSNSFKNKNKCSCLIPCEKVTSKVESSTVLIIAELSIPQCRYYRVDSKVILFKEHGILSNVLSWRDTIQCINKMQTCGGVIFYRVPFVETVQLLYAEARRLSLPIFYDIDDLVFDVALYSKNKNLKKLSSVEVNNLLNGAELYQLGICNADACISSTKTLKKHLEKYCKGETFVVENCLGIKQEVLRDKHCDKIGSNVFIYYGSGTRTHDKDFEIASVALLNVLSKFDNVILVLHGFLDIPAAFSKFQGRVLRVGFVDFEMYQEATGDYDIAIAPLEDTEFNNAKSNIKYIEASQNYIPMVCSPVDSFVDVITDGYNGYIATNDQEWEECLDKLIQNREHRREVGKRAYENVLRRYSLQVIAQSQLLNVVSALGFKVKADVLRILVVNVYYQPFSFGGATIVVDQLTNELNKHEDVEVYVFTGTNELNQDQLIHCFEVNGIKVFAVRFVNSDALQDHTNETVNSVFGDILDSVSFDAVHFHSIQQLGAGLAFECLTRNIPYFITLHDAWWLCPRQFMITTDGDYCQHAMILPSLCATTCGLSYNTLVERNSILRRVLLNAVCCFTPSESFRTLYLQNCLPESAVVTNKNGVLPPNQQENTITKLTGPIRFAYLGGKCTHKGYDFLVQAFELVGHRQYTLILTDIQTLFGKSTLSAADWPCPDQVHVIKPYGQDAIDDFFKDIDVLLFPSQWKESFGLTVREALIRNVWVLSTDCGAPVEDIVAGINGDIVPFGDVCAFSEKLIEYMSQTDALRSRKSNIVDIRTFDQQAKELLGYIKTYLSKNS